MRKLENRGAALVTVIVVISFVSILATVGLYLSGMNFTMKATDIKTKDSFYEAETAMEEVKAYMVLQASDAFAEAYSAVMAKYGAYTDGASRAVAFKDFFFSALQSNWDAKLPGADKQADCVTLLNSVVADPYKGCLTLEPGSTGKIDLSQKANGYALLQGVTLTYTKDDFTTVITTDFMIEIPDVNWEADKSNKSWVAGDGSDKLKNVSIDLAGNVTYSNWTKK